MSAPGGWAGVRRRLGWRTIYHPSTVTRTPVRRPDGDAEGREMAVRFGLLGSGFMAATYAQCLARHVPDGVLTAVALGSRAADLAAAHGVAMEPSAEALLARPDVDAVIIATPHYTH